MPLITVRRALPDVELKEDRDWTRLSLEGLVPEDIAHIYLEIIIRSEKPDDVVLEVRSPSMKKADERDDADSRSRRLIAKCGRIASSYVWMRYDPTARAIEYKTQGVESATKVSFAVVAEFYWPETVRAQAAFRQTTAEGGSEEPLDLGDWTPFGA